MAGKGRGAETGEAHSRAASSYVAGGHPPRGENSIQQVFTAPTQCNEGRLGPWARPGLPPRVARGRTSRAAEQTRFREATGQARAEGRALPGLSSQPTRAPPFAKNLLSHRPLGMLPRLSQDPGAGGGGQREVATEFASKIQQEACRPERRQRQALGVNVISFRPSSLTSPN